MTSIVETSQPLLKEIVVNRGKYSHFCFELCPPRLSYILDPRNSERINPLNEFSFIANKVVHSKIVPIDISLSNQAKIYAQLKNNPHGHDFIRESLDYNEHHSLVVNILNKNLGSTYKTLSLLKYPLFTNVFIQAREKFMVEQIRKLATQPQTKSNLIAVIGAYHFDRVIKQLIESEGYSDQATTNSF